MLLTYQPCAILLTGTEMMALLLTGHVSEQQKMTCIFLSIFYSPGMVLPSTYFFNIVTGLLAAAIFKLRESRVMLHYAILIVILTPVVIFISLVPLSSLSWSGG